MADITIQQAYALATGALVQFSGASTVMQNRGYISSVGLNARATSLKRNKLSSLIRSTDNISALNLGDISYTNISTGSTSTILADGANPDDNAYLLINTTTNANGGVLDYLQGSSSIDTTTAVLSNFESDLHRTGRIIFNKLKK
jgi:hypothetical protein